MTTELEQKFFRAFGIEPSCPQGCAIVGLSQNCDECAFYDCPPITDKIFLKLICILNSTNGINCTAYESKNISDLKKEILNKCMSISDDIELKTKIQQLFKEEE